MQPWIRGKADGRQSKNSWISVTQTGRKKGWTLIERGYDYVKR